MTKDPFGDLLRLVLAVTPPLSVMLRKGVIAGNPITYISRLYEFSFFAYLSPWLTKFHRWNTNNVPRWSGFFSEVIPVPQTS